MNREEPEVERVALVEPLCWGMEHVPFNAALIASVAAAYPRAEADIYAEPGQLAALRELLGWTRPAYADRLRWQQIEIPARKARGWERFTGTGRLLRDLDARFRAAPPGALIMSTIDVTLLGHLKARLFGSWRGRRVLAVFHELLALLERRRSRRRLGLLSALAAPHPPGLHYLVLSDAIRHHLKQVAPRTGRRVFSIDHPSLLGDVPLLEPAHRPPPLRFGFVGGGREAKRLLEFTRLAREIRQRCPDAEFHVVGSVPPGLAREALEGLDWSNERLPLPDYVAHIRRLSHVIWLGDPAHYRLVASGSLADTIALGIPLVCQSGPFSNHLFQRFGDIGWMCDSLTEVHATIMGLLSNFSGERYDAQRRRLLEARERLAPEACAPEVGLALSPVDRA